MAHTPRTFLAAPRNSREEDDGLLDPPLWKFDEVCGHYSVRTFEVPGRGMPRLIDDPALQVHERNSGSRGWNPRGADEV